MTTRRNFLKTGAATGIVFCGCGLLHRARTASHQGGKEAAGYDRWRAD